MVKDTAKKETVKKTKDRGLGRGLDALFGDEEAQFIEDTNEEVVTTAPRKKVGIGYLYANPDQPRRHFDEVALKELSASIKEYGLLQPILVRPSKTDENMFEIVAGERRWRASQMAQLHEVPVVIRELDDKETFKIALVENLQRQDLNPIEEGLGYQKLIDEYDISPDEVGEIVGKSRSHVRNMTRLLALPASVQVMVEVGDLSMGHARALLATDDCEQLALKVIEGNLSVRATEELVAEYEGKSTGEKFDAVPKEKRVGFSDKDADTLALEKEVSTSLGMNVSIDMKNEHDGKMQIDFKSLDQLDEILQRLAQTPRRI